MSQGILSSNAILILSGNRFISFCQENAGNCCKYPKPASSDVTYCYKTYDKPLQNFSITGISTGPFPTEIKNGNSYGYYADGHLLHYGDFIIISNYANTENNVPLGYMYADTQYLLDPVSLQLTVPTPEIACNTTDKVAVPMCSYYAANSNLNGSSQFKMTDDIAYSIWVIVASDGYGYFCDNHIQNYGPSPPNVNTGSQIPCSATNNNPRQVMNGDSVFLQNLGFQLYGGTNQNVYLCLDKDGQNTLSWVSISNPFPTSQDTVNASFILANSCMASKDVGCPVNCKIPSNVDLSYIKSGYYLTIRNVPNNYLVMYDSGDYGFNDSPGSNNVNGTSTSTFLIKKIVPGKNEYYTSEDGDEAIIHFGDLFVLYGQDIQGKSGLVSTVSFGLLSEGNNITLDTGTQVIDSDNGCGVTGSFYTQWAFVDTDGTGNISEGSKGNPVTFGKSLFIQNLGYEQCFSIDKLATLGLTESCYWVTNQGATVNTPNLNFATLTDYYPGINGEDTSAYQFFCMIAQGSTLLVCPEDGCTVNDCQNCNGDNSSGTCGCNQPWTPGGNLGRIGKIFKDLLICIIVIIAIVVIIVIIIIIIKALKSPKPKSDE